MVMLQFEEIIFLYNLTNALVELRLSNNCIQVFSQLARKLTAAAFKQINKVINLHVLLLLLCLFCFERLKRGDILQTHTG